jgi:hypothetical protein
MLAGTAAVPVAVNVTGLPLTPEPATVAVSVLVPGADPRVHWVSVTFPAESVVCEAPATVPPPAVTAKATTTPATGRCCASRTITAGGSGTAMPASAL